MSRNFVVRLTSLQRHNVVRSYVNVIIMVMNAIFKIKNWKSKGMQEKESNMNVQRG